MRTIAINPHIERAIDLKAAPEYAGIARRFTRNVLWSWRMRHLVDDVCQVVGELVANAFPGGAHRLTIHLDHGRGVVRLAVRDRRADEKPTRRNPDECDESGRGLLIVEALADDWGYEHTGTGNTVWAEFRVRGPDA